MFGGSGFGWSRGPAHAWASAEIEPPAGVPSQNSKAAEGEPQRLYLIEPAANETFQGITCDRSNLTLSRPRGVSMALQ
jgi:hypothetical protein